MNLDLTQSREQLIHLGKCFTSKAATEPLRMIRRPCPRNLVLRPPPFPPAPAPAPSEPRVVGPWTGEAEHAPLLSERGPRASSSLVGRERHLQGRYPRRPAQSVQTWWTAGILSEVRRTPLRSKNAFCSPPIFLSNSVQLLMSKGMGRQT